MRVKTSSRLNMMKTLSMAALTLLVLSVLAGPVGLTGEADASTKGRSPANRYFLNNEFNETYNSTDHYLIPEKVPDPTKDDQALLYSELDNKPDLKFTHHIVGRSPDNGIIPTLNLWINSKSSAGKVFRCRLAFDADGQDGFEAKYWFGPYTTTLTNSEENIHLTPDPLEGQLKKMEGSSGGLMELWFIRDDNQEEPLIIYCGAYEHHSYVDTPYVDPTSISGDGSADGGDGDDDEDGGGGWGWLEYCCISGIIIIIVIVVAFLYARSRGDIPSGSIRDLAKGGGKSKKKAGDDEEVSGSSKASSRRRGKGGGRKRSGSGGGGGGGGGGGKGRGRKGKKKKKKK